MDSSDKIMKTAASSGLIVGGALVLLNLVEFLFGVSTGIIFIFVIVAGIMYSTIVYRDKCLGGTISYGTSLLHGMLVCGFSFIILGVFYYMYATFINPEGYMEYIKMVSQLAKEHGLSGREMSDLMTNPFVVIVYMFTGLLIGVIVSAITSIFTKKE